LHVTIQVGKLKVRNHVGTDWGVTVHMNFTCDMFELTLAQNLVQSWHVVNMTANVCY
jgi:hypothetical protein